MGGVTYYSGKFEAYQRTYVLTDFLGISTIFLYFILDGKLKDAVNSQKLGAAMPYIKVGMLKDLKVPLPPIHEQHRIVAILDEAFAGIAAAKEKAEQNLKNAKEVFEGYLESVFSQRGDGWVDRQLASLCNKITVGHVGTMKKEY